MLILLIFQSNLDSPCWNLSEYVIKFVEQWQFNLFKTNQSVQNISIYTNQFLTMSSYWNASLCVPRKSFGMYCVSDIECSNITGLECSNGNCQCILPNQKYFKTCLIFSRLEYLISINFSSYWSNTSSSCLPKKLNGIACASSIECLTSNGLGCQNNNCQCVNSPNL